MPDKQLFRKALYEQVERCRLHGWQPILGCLMSDWLNSASVIRSPAHQEDTGPSWRQAKLLPRHRCPLVKTMMKWWSLFVEPPKHERSRLAFHLDARLADEAKPESLRGTHPLFTITKEEFVGAKSNIAGILTPSQPVSLDLSVSRNQFRRTLFSLIIHLRNDVLSV